MLFEYSFINRPCVGLQVSQMDQMGPLTSFLPQTLVRALSRHHAQIHQNLREGDLTTDKINVAELKLRRGDALADCENILCEPACQMALEGVINVQRHVPHWRIWKQDENGKVV